ncbi:DnaJ domain protein [Opisthorchis viverrini]|uniref:DnaJ domain protein n=1 Tax=Opisthorchis viverrini TaxID=6198 RepID=A0A1S8WX53_OPIVI|nr:DnaJ domain protein [Opisthorchis viverrini]
MGRLAPKLVLTNRLSVIAYIALHFLCLQPPVNGDHYSTLGLPRSASQADIKNAYRRLAQKYHPDKNSDADAAQKFMEVNEAYGVLSKPERRAEYDAFGTVHEESGGHSHGFHPRFHSQFMHAPFEEIFEFFPGFSKQPAFSSNVMDIDFRSYRLTHLPRTRSVPLLILGYSDFCIPCQRLRPLWSQLADELTPLGAAVAAVNLERDGALRDELRVLHVPSITIVVDGQINYYSQSGFAHGQIIDTLRQILLRSNPSRSKAIPSFMSTTLDTPLIYHIQTNSTFFEDFHPGWRRDSRPRMVLFKPLAVPSLRYLLAAFRAADHVAAGFVNTESSQAREFVRHFDVPVNEESLLIFHEDPDVPVYRASDARLSPTDLDEPIMAYSQMTVPRIFSTARLLDLCPTDGAEPRSQFASASELRTGKLKANGGHRTHRHFCLVLLLHSKLANLEAKPVGHADHWLSALRSLEPFVREQIQRIRSPHHVLQVKLVHVYMDRQATWLRRLSYSANGFPVDLTSPGLKLYIPPCSFTHHYPDNIGRLVLLWRISPTHTAVSMLPVNSEAHPSNLLPLSANPIPVDWSPAVAASRIRTALLLDLVALLNPVVEKRTADFLRNPIPQNWHLTSDYVIEEHVVDELAAPLWLRLRRRLWQWSGDAAAWFLDLLSQPLSFVFSTTAIILGLLLFSLTRLVMQATEAERPIRRPKVSKPDEEPRPSEQPRTHSATAPPNGVSSSSFRKITPAPVVALNPLTYDSLVLDAVSGHQLLVICLRGDGGAQDRRLCANFASKTAHVISPRVRCAQLSLERYAGWYANLLRVARSGMAVRVSRDSDSPSVADPGTVFINPANCVGTVLALNGARRYFSIYHPLMPGAESSSTVSDSESSVYSDTEANIGSVTDRPQRRLPTVRKRRIFGHIFGMESDEDEDERQLQSSSRSRPPPPVLLESELLDGLPNWLDRLFEGSLPRYQLIEWPSTLRGNELDESD